MKNMNQLDNMMNSMINKMNQMNIMMNSMINNMKQMINMMNNIMNNKNQINNINNLINNINQTYMNLLNLMNNKQNQKQENNETNEEEELIKYVLKGMGEESSGIIGNDIDIIMNFVPSFDSDKIITFSGCKGKLITIKFKKGDGIYIELIVPEDAKLKDVFVEYGKKLKLNNLNNVCFLINGERFTQNSEVTLKQKNIQDKSVFLVVMM